MSRQKMLYKRLLDISLFVSYVMMILLLAALLYGVVVQAYDFSSSAPSMIKAEHRYLGSIIFSLVAFIVIFVVGARVFLAFIDNVENLESASSYRLRKMEEDRKRARGATKEQKQRRIREKVIPKMVMEKEETSKMIAVVEEKEEEILLQEKMDDEVIEEPSQITESNERILEDNKERNEKDSFIKVESNNENVEEKPDLYTKFINYEDEEIKEEQVKVEHPNVLVTKVKDDKKITKKYYTRLTKSEINEIVSKVTGLSTYKSRRFVNTLLNTIKEQLVEGNNVSIDDFGKFSKVFVAEKQGVNPRTGEKIRIEEHHKVKFTPFKKFKEDITNDVVETKTRYLLTKPAEKKLSEDQFQNELIKEKIAEEHIEVEVISKYKPKKKKTKVPKITKVDIIEYGNKNTDLSKNKMNKFLNSLTKVVQENLSNKEDIIIGGFGKFTTVHIPSKDGVNPVTNEKIVIPEHNQVRLRFEKTFKDKINQK